SMTSVLVILAAVTVLIIRFGASGKRSVSMGVRTSAGSFGQQGILGCTFKPHIWMSSIVIQWAKAIALGKGYSPTCSLGSVWASVLQSPNSLSLSSWQSCSSPLSIFVASSGPAPTLPCPSCVGGSRTAHSTPAFSTPKVHVENSSSSRDTLQSEAPRWFPQHAVHRTAYSDSGECLPHVANNSYELNAENITLKVVSFLHGVTANVTYTSGIENSIAKATGNIKVTDFSITRGTNLQLVNLNTKSVSSSLP
ncbi:VTCN1 inhibitor, partial [Eubucco bourcierii]|nr:VTCN1 inhibitor [Eubucco bourcierii]